jgi:nicotinate dehydrogenase subunit B
MRDEPPSITPLPEDEHQIIEPVDFDFGLRRRTFVQLVATGLMIVTAPWSSSAQERGDRRGGRGGGATRNVWERIHIGKDGTITLLAGKVEVGQGSRAEYAQAAAEELRVPAEQVQVVMSDTGLTPNDGNTAGSGSTPRTVPAIRLAAAAAREMLLELAAKHWNAERASLQMRDGKITQGANEQTLTFAELAQSE